MPIQEASEQMQSQSIIVIHPGSQNLRIGRASDLSPHVILHAVARRRLPNGIRYEDHILPPLAQLSEQTLRDMEEARLQVSHTLQSCLQSNGNRRYATPPQQVAAFNRRVQPETLGPSTEAYVKPEKECNTVFGNDILHLDPAADFNIHFPWRRGDLNIHPGPGGSLTGVLADLEAIWNYAISTKLEIPLSTLKHYRAVLIIPDIYNRFYLKELTRMLLLKMGFGGCFLVQDHVAATFGAGLGYACVIDVGDQKTSISCVEDAISHRTTRVRLNFGGSDITQTFYWLLQKSCFPFRHCNVMNRSHAILLQSLKEMFCHVNLDICGSQEKKFTVMEPNEPVIQYTIQVGDEAVVAPLSMFTPELFSVTNSRGIHTQERNMGDPEDPHDEHYLRETSRKKENLEQSGLVEEQILEPGEDDLVVDNIDTGTSYNKEFVVPPQQILGLDQAVLQSIDRCPSEDVKRKMYGCILIVGSGMKFHGISKWLQNRIALQTPYLYRSEQVYIITNAKEMDSGMTCWKGAAILSCLESAQELWVYPAEFEKWGVKILRERAPFMW
ncbi:UNVERIFIED_CONTAM: hypothetical protein PYX00_001668 [Menopon gallinae]|uniref:Actin-related protein 8 n=1 Tax=Menopon gallinae TaxID=328185 RepID=A0AAW2IEB3_9NEOP